MCSVWGSEDPSIAASAILVASVRSQCSGLVDARGNSVFIHVEPVVLDQIEFPVGEVGDAGL